MPAHAHSKMALRLWISALPRKRLEHFPLAPLSVHWQHIRHTTCNLVVSFIPSQLTVLTEYSCAALFPLHHSCASFYTVNLICQDFVLHFIFLIRTSLIIKVVVSSHTHLFKNFTCIYVFSTCICLCGLSVQCPRRPEEGVGFWRGSYSCEPPRLGRLSRSALVFCWFADIVFKKSKLGKEYKDFQDLICIFPITIFIHSFSH